MNFAKRVITLMMAVLLCAACAVPVFATELKPEGTQDAEDFSQQFTEVNETVYAVASVNVRSGPGTQYTRLGTLRYGYAITRIGVSNTGWSMVLWEDQVAYVFTSYLSITRPKGSNTKIDDTDLLYQIAIANGLNRADYTQESWWVLQEALVKANDALNGNNQSAADEAEKNLTAAIGALVKMDYSALRSVLREVEELAKSSNATSLWYDLASTALEGQDLLTSGDQAAVNAIAEQLHAMLELVREEMTNAGTPNVVIQEIPVEVPPTSSYCNIPAHRAWPVMFFISLALNVALVAVIVVYIRNKKKNQHDDTPLVDYDIFDDTF